MAYLLGKSQMWRKWGIEWGASSRKWVTFILEKKGTSVKILKTRNHRAGGLRWGARPHGRCSGRVWVGRKGIKSLHFMWPVGRVKEKRLKKQNNCALRSLPRSQSLKNIGGVWGGDHCRICAQNTQLSRARVESRKG